MTSTTNSLATPTLPLLYFGREEPIITDDVSLEMLPAELIHKCLVEYSDWGMLSKLSCVRRDWSMIVSDAAHVDQDSKWGLAQALLRGSSGLQPNHHAAMALLMELAEVETNEQQFPVFVDDTNEQNELDNDDGEEGEEDDEEVMTSLIDGLDDTHKNPSEEIMRAAMKEIAKCYMEGGMGIDQNAERGVAWLKACHLVGKDVEAAHGLAVVYECGSCNVPIDVVAAARWFRRGAKAGHIESMAELGLCYELGCGVDQSDEKALDWYLRAARRGNVTAKFSVAEAFEEARGVPQSDTEACLWYYRAAVLGDQDSKLALRRLESIARIVVPGVTALLNE